MFYVLLWQRASTVADTDGPTRAAEAVATISCVLSLRRCGATTTALSWLHSICEFAGLFPRAVGLVSCHSPSPRNNDGWSLCIVAVDFHLTSRWSREKSNMPSPGRWMNTTTAVGQWSQAAQWWVKLSSSRVWQSEAFSDVRFWCFGDDKQTVLAEFGRRWYCCAASIDEIPYSVVMFSKQQKNWCEAQLTSPRARLQGADTWRINGIWY